MQRSTYTFEKVIIFLFLSLSFSLNPLMMEEIEMKE